jgi:KaiC/GvpD/RAD55 family RecA-like ATPase
MTVIETFNSARALTLIREDWLMDLSQLEKEYKWFDAAKSYEQELQSEPRSDSRLADSWQRIGFCYCMASRQAESVEEFKKLRQLGAEAYEKAAKAFQEDSSENQGKAAECLALAEYTRSWIAPSASERVTILHACRGFLKRALETFKNKGDELSYAKTCNTLSLCLFDLLFVTSVYMERVEISEEGVNNANEAVLVLSKLKSKDELLTALSLACLQTWQAAYLCDENERKNVVKTCLGYSKDAIELSKEVDNPYCKATAMWAGAISTCLFSENLESSLECAKEMLRLASATRDNYFKGIAFYTLELATDLSAQAEADPDKKKLRHEEIIKYAEEAIKYFSLVCQDSDIAEAYLYYAESYSSLARELALKPIEKLAFSKKAVRIGEKGLEYAICSGSVDAVGSTLHALSKAYQYYSILEPRKEEKPGLLQNALGYRRECIRTAEQSFTSNSWILGVNFVYAAQIEADLANLQTKEEGKAPFLEDAVSDIEKGISYCNKYAVSGSVAWYTASIAVFEDSFGGMLEERYLLTSDKENLTRANVTYGNAAEKFKQVDMPSRVAESYWKIAKNLDVSGDHLKAAEQFENAFAGYKAAAKKMYQFGEFYLDYAYYMKAWSEIQTAKLAHTAEQYATAMQHYEKTSDLLKQSKTWSFLTTNFSAWSLLEQAEDLSRKEKCTEAIDAFKKAVNLFEESQRTLRAQLMKIDKVDEKNLVAKLVEASNLREEYGRGRIAIEEARILDQQGDHTKSSEKYEAAAAIFQNILAAGSEQAQKEIKPLIHLCGAWKKMTMAEAKKSPILYEEAADLFRIANECSLTESASLLALAHSNFCKALEAGMEFEITRNASMYAETTKYMDAAAINYLKAGYESSFEYAKATQRLFDAYVYMNSAKRETDPEKEAKCYLMAEKVLQNSLESFIKARHAEKTSQVQKLLEKVKEERKLALSLSEVFHAPTLTSTTSSFATITPSEEIPVGLERFAHADIEAKLVQPISEIKVGEDVSFEIHIINVGKEPVFLTRIENVLPAGFQLVGKSDTYSVDGQNLVLRGKRLNPLKTDELKIVFRAFRMGEFKVNPRIICVDEVGRELLCEPDAKVFNIAEAVLSGRVSTGFEDLDNLLLGGIPKNYAVVLASPSIDERELLVKRFIEVGTKKGEVTFYVTAEPDNGRGLAEEFQSSFYLFVCNPRAEVIVKSLPNVFTTRGMESLTDIDIALTKSFRMLDKSRSGPKRACIEIVSDVLLQHHAVITRKWLSGLLPDLRSRGFTTLAVINPHMHPPEEVQAILGLFEGEIRISERETERGIEKILRIRKLYNQRYLENELTLTREKLEG